MSAVKPSTLCPKRIVDPTGHWLLCIRMAGHDGEHVWEPDTADTPPDWENPDA